jgi:ribosomal protein S18 acetylase RimI-like enzyme
MAFAVRRYDTVRDRARVLAMDRTFTTDRVYDVRRDAESFTLVEVTATPPLTGQRAGNDELDAGTPDWDTAWVATGSKPGSEEIFGFAATTFEPWNRRQVLQHLYVDGPARRQGVARALLAQVVADARAHGAVHVWVETSTLNHPAVAACRRLGFRLSGLDLDLYAGTEAAGEVALFLTHPLGY